MSCPSIVFRKNSILQCPFVYQHRECRYSDREVPFGLITHPAPITSLSMILQMLALLPSQWVSAMTLHWNHGDFTDQDQVPDQLVHSLMDLSTLLLS